MHYLQICAMQLVAGLASAMEQIHHQTINVTGTGATD